jgi:hypothetical protein
VVAARGYVEQTSPLRQQNHYEADNENEETLCGIYVPKMVARAEVLSYIRPRAMDVFAPTQRSEIMRRVRSAGTEPEVVVRGILRRVGVKYRSGRESLPGKPDVAIPDLQKAIPVRGCCFCFRSRSLHI